MSHCASLTFWRFQRAPSDNRCATTSDPSTDAWCTDIMTEESAIKVVEMCINEMQTRFMLSQPNFIIKKVDKEGVSVISFGEDPADT